MNSNQSFKNIPSGWKQVKLGDVFDFKNGLNKEKKYFGNGTPIINYVDVYNGGGLFVKAIKGLVEVSESEKERFEVKKGDVFFTRTSETLNEIGFSAVALDDFRDTVFSGFVLRARQKGNLLLLNYAKYCFKTQKARQEIKEKSSYTTRALTSGSLLKHVNILLPSLSEQSRIVSVLETWDEAIEKISKKIQIKKQVKKGLMQNLLTGKKRLKGFIDKWNTISLGDVCKIRTGKKDVNEGNVFGIYPFFTCAKDCTYSDNYSFDTEAILIAGNGEVGNCRYFKGKFEAYQRTYVLDDFSENIQYIYVYLSYFFQGTISSQKQMGAMPYIKLGMLQGYKIKIPSLEKEQEAIANILITADKEIQLLEKKLQVIKNQKNYLLNNLITGKIRTPESMKV